MDLELKAKDLLTKCPLLSYKWKWCPMSICRKH